ncbi:hypothetical protein AVEN_91206-1 [Araneus ventricosus]|uniref:Uncharacterized protein n=1 Tax=Araneus ventricosus TaxID=182803 RepID=A0A4Y2T5G8_ARAVE|nr:hypothetical protein AVEN_91206-1 [Araneus ventricosus]
MLQGRNPHSRSDHHMHQCKPKFIYYGPSGALARRGDGEEEDHSGASGHLTRIDGQGPSQNSPRGFSSYLSDFQGNPSKILLQYTNIPQS